MSNLWISRTNFLRNAASAVVVATAGLSLAGCGDQAAPVVEFIRPVKTVTVEPSAPVETLRLSGAVRARTTATLAFRVPGKVVERAVEIGDHVEAGNVLARLDTGDAEIALRNAETALASAQSQHDNAAKSLDRYQALLTKGFVAEATLEQRQIELDQANTALAAATSSRDQAANQLAYSTLKADAPGIVTEVPAQPGQVVAAGTPVVVVAQDGDMEAEVAVPENQIGHVKPGDRLAVGFWSDAAITETGTVREVSGSADPASRTFAVRVALPADPRVKLGMTATVTVEVPEANSGLIVPLTALSQQSGKPVVWVVDPANETVSAREVRMEAFSSEGVRVTSGLSPGDRVVAAGAQFMLPHEKVRIAAPSPVVANAGTQSL